MQNIIYVHVSNLTKILCNSKYFLLTIVLKSYHVGLYIDLVGFFFLAAFILSQEYITFQLSISVVAVCHLSCLPPFEPFFVWEIPTLCESLGEQNNLQKLSAASCN